MNIQSSSESLPSDFPIPTPPTGTIDDDDAPSDEKPDENEAAGRETDEREEAPEEMRTEYQSPPG